MAEEIKKSLNDIQTGLQKIGIDACDPIEKMRDIIDKNPNTVGDIKSAVEKTAEYIPKLLSGEISEIIIGSLNTIGVWSDLIPTVGPVIKGATGVLAFILGSVGGRKNDIGKIVEEELRNCDLLSEACSVSQIYRVSMAYLNSETCGQQLTQQETPTLAANVPIYNGLEYLSKLKYQIEKLIISTDPETATRTVKYVVLYVRLSALKCVILWQMYLVIQSTGHSKWTADAIKRVINENDKDDKAFVELITKPNYKMATFFAVFDPWQFKDIIEFVTSKGCQFQNLENDLDQTKTSLISEKWKTWWMVMGNMVTGKIWGHENPPDNKRSRVQFYFDAVPGELNVFYMRSVEWPDWYIYMKKNTSCRGVKKKPGDKGQWKIIKFEDGKFMLCTKKWLGRFIYMSGTPWGEVRGDVYGDPGNWGHWIIKQDSVKKVK